MRLQVFFINFARHKEEEIIQTQLIFNKHISYED